MPGKAELPPGDSPRTAGRGKEADPLADAAAELLRNVAAEPVPDAIRDLAEKLDREVARKGKGRAKSG